ESPKSSGYAGRPARVVLVTAVAVSCGRAASQFASATGDVPTPGIGSFVPSGWPATGRAYSRTESKKLAPSGWWMKPAPGRTKVIAAAVSPSRSQPAGSVRATAGVKLTER